jgi:hypothetical protein
MGWLPLRSKKHEGHKHPEPGAVPDSGKPGYASGAGVMGTSHQSVVPPPGPYNVIHNNSLAGGWNVITPSGVFAVGPKYPNLKAGDSPVDVTGYCGHRPTVALVAGCQHDHIISWVTCHECQMETLRQVRHNPDKCYLLECGDLFSDLIYSYLPGDPEYHNLARRMFEASGNQV